MIANKAPYSQFADLNGNPLENGYINIGTANLNPIVNPITVYWDSALTQPAAQPLRTINGYVVRNGTIANVYSAAAYSLTVRDKKGRLVYYFPDSSVFTDNASQITFLQNAAGAVISTVQIKLYEFLSVKDFGAVGDGVTNDAVALQAALDAVKNQGGGTLYFPPGKYRTLSRLKLQGTDTLNMSVKLLGGGSGNAFQSAANVAKGTIIVADTGGICLDLAGSSQVTLEDIGIYAGTSAPSTVGILYQRIASSPFSAKNNLVRVQIYMGPSNPAANGGVGTVAVINKRGEHHHYSDSWFYADRPHIIDGNSLYSGIVSPDYAEATPPGATAGVGVYSNCAWLSTSGYSIELNTTNFQTFLGGYIQISNASFGINLNTYNISPHFLNISAELGNSGGAPTGFLRIENNVDDLIFHAADSNMASLEATRTAAGAQVAGFDFRLTGNFAAIFNNSTEAGGALVGGSITYSSSLGHTLPNSGIYGATLYDVPMAGGTTRRGAFQIRQEDEITENKVFHSGGTGAIDPTQGRDTTPVTTTTYVAPVFIPSTKLLTGASMLAGSAVAGQFTMFLCDNNGTVVASTASTAYGGAAGYNDAAFLSPYLAAGPNTYYLCLQMNNVASRFRSHAVGNFPTEAVAAGVYGSLTSIPVPGFFNIDEGPIADVY